MGYECSPPLLKVQLEDFVIPLKEVFL